MLTTRVEQRFGTASPLVGVVHLPPLPGYPGSPGMTRLVEHALADLDAFEGGGLAGVLVENEHDRPYRVTAGTETVAAIAVIARELVRASHGIAIGVEILLNDPRRRSPPRSPRAPASSAPTTSSSACDGPRIPSEPIRLR